MYDLALIGFGPANIEAFNIAVKNGLKIIVFEKNIVGGTCLNIGCIPTKTILHTAQLFKELKNSSDLGIQMSISIGGKFYQEKMKLFLNLIKI